MKVSSYYLVKFTKYLSYEVFKKYNSKIQHSLISVYHVRHDEMFSEKFI